MKRCEEEFIRSPLLLLSKQGQSDRSTSLEAVTAPFSDRGNVGQREEWLSWLRCVAFNGDPSRPGY